MEGNKASVLAFSSGVLQALALSRPPCQRICGMSGGAPGGASSTPALMLTTLRLSLLPAYTPAPLLSYTLYLHSVGRQVTAF